MDNHDTALRFVELFCAADLSGLAELLASDVHVVGPLSEWRSREAYLQSLREDPPEPGTFTAVKLVEDGKAVSVFHDYENSSQRLTVGQLFTFRDHRIAHILLVFDTAGLLSP